MKNSRIKTILFAAVGFYIRTSRKRWGICYPNGDWLYGISSRLCLYFKVFHWIQLYVHCVTFNRIGPDWMDTYLPFSLAGGMIQTYKEFKARA